MEIREYALLQGKFLAPTLGQDLNNLLFNIILIMNFSFSFSLEENKMLFTY